VAKVQFGDLILAVAGRPIETAIDLKMALTGIPFGSPVGLQVFRAGAKCDTTVVVRERNRA
jgi:S1-C subfamily serine protease